MATGSFNNTNRAYVDFGSGFSSDANAFSVCVAPDIEWVLDEDGDLWRKGKLFMRNYLSSFCELDPGDEKVKTVWSVSIWSVGEQKWICYDEPYVGSEANARTVLAMAYNIDPKKLEDYDFLIAGRGKVRESLDE